MRGGRDCSRDGDVGEGGHVVDRQALAFERNAQLPVGHAGVDRDRREIGIHR